MIKYLVDTDVVIDYFNKQEKRAFSLEQLLNRASVGISILSITELRSGWNTQQANHLLPLVYKLFFIEFIAEDIAELAGKWRQEYKSKGVTIQTVDATIAATACVNKYCLVTNNKKDYPMPELSFFKTGE